MALSRETFFPKGFWIRGALGLLLLAFAGGSFLAAGVLRTADEAAPINVVFITVDTLRADHVGVYGHHLDTTPALDRLAAAGVRFDDATVQWPQTWPSIASMMTATYASSTGVRFQPRLPLALSKRTLAEILRDGGYQTAAVVANATIGKQFYFDQGFDVFVESWMDEVKKQTGEDLFVNAPGKVKQFTNAATVTDQARDVMQRFQAGKPFFLWLHYIDPHGPYIPPPPYADMFANGYAPEPFQIRFIPEYQRQNLPNSDAIIDDLAFYKAQYDGSIRYFDDQLSRLLPVIAPASSASRTLLVVTADHGEGLGEHRYYLEHGAVPWQTTARVPLLMVLEGKLPAGRVVKAPVGAIDIAPTIIDILGMPPPPEFKGCTLLPLMLGDDSTVPLVFMESGHREPTQLVVRKGPWKLVRTRASRDQGSLRLPLEALFNLVDDPAENANVIDQHAELATELRAALDTWSPKGKKALKRRASRPRKIDPATKEQLRALGYEE